jgi:uncharacterized protein (DUF2236 family)
MLINSSDLERELSSLQESHLKPSWGMFGPDSALWKVNRESIVLLGAGRALLLQLSHPLIATAVAEHSNVLHDPIRRLHQTFNIMFKMVFGTMEQCLEASRTLHRRHSGIRGCLSESLGSFRRGTSYDANEETLLQWVHATLVETASLVYTSALPPLSNDEQEQYYQESRRMAGLFGLASGSLPPTWGAFRGYFEETCRCGILCTSGSARDFVGRMLNTYLNHLPVWYRAVTAQMLPPVLREALELPYSEADQTKATRAWKWVRQIHPLLPYHLRYVGPYQEAQARIKGVAPSFITKSINHFWIGRSTL